MKKMLSIAAVMAAAVPLGLWKSTPSAAEGGVGVESRAMTRVRPGPDPPKHSPAT